MKSFYEILEIPERASAAEIRSAYLKLAREYHPDRVPEHLTKLRADAEDKFKQVQQAWAVLGDPVKRRRYDLQAQAGHQPVSTPSPNTRRPAAVRRPLWDAFLRYQDIGKMAGIILAATLAFVLVGRFFISREAATRPTWKPGDAKPGSPLQIGVRQYHTKPRRIQTWPQGGGDGLDIQLLSLAVQPEDLEISFRVRAGAHVDLLLYEPPSATSRTRNVLGKEVVPDRDLEDIYIQDNTGAKFHSTTGLVGGQQINFNLYNFTRRINLRPREEVVLSAKFPPITGSASSITFVSPGLAKWQPEWRWPAIALK